MSHIERDIGVLGEDHRPCGHEHATSHESGGCLDNGQKRFSCPHWRMNPLPPSSRPPSCKIIPTPETTQRSHFTFSGSFSFLAFFVFCKYGRRRYTWSWKIRRLLRNFVCSGSFLQTFFSQSRLDFCPALAKPCLRTETLLVRNVPFGCFVCSLF